MDEALSQLEVEVQNGWKINQPFEICEHVTDIAIVLALTENRMRVIDWLLSKKVKLNLKTNPAIVAAAGYCSRETLQALLDNGADINALDNVGKNVISVALYAKRIDIIPFLIESGFDITKDGRSLRQAVFGRQFKAVKLLLDLGYDANLHQACMVHPENPTPVHVAARNINDFKTVQLLVERGADVTIKDANGDRPFSDAFTNKDVPLMIYLKSLEPVEWHDVDSILDDLAQYNLPDSLINICKSDHRTIKIEKGAAHGVGYIVLCTAILLKTAKFRKKIFVEFVSEIDNYDNFLVWYPAKKCIAYMDYEHDEFRLLGTWEEFLSNPSQFFEHYLSDYL